jgi:uncharacterized membrane protein YhhN
MPRRRSSRLALGCFGAVAAVDLVAELLGWRSVAFGCRMLLMPLLAWSVCATGPLRRRSVILLLVALGFSWLGDLSAAVLLKIAFFLVAQIVYVVAFWPSRRRSLITRPPLAVAYGLALITVVGVVATAAGPLAVSVGVYGTSLAVMALLATGMGRLTGLGGALFLVSDIVLAIELFVAPGVIPYALFVNMALYLPAQLLITLGVLHGAPTEVGSPAVDRVA